MELAFSFFSTGFHCSHHGLRLEDLFDAVGLTGFRGGDGVLIVSILFHLGFDRLLDRHGSFLAQQAHQHLLDLGDFFLSFAVINHDLLFFSVVVHLGQANT